jgi:hypothetical protein
MAKDQSIALNATWDMAEWTVAVWVRSDAAPNGHGDLLRSGSANIAIHNWENGRVAYGKAGQYDLEFGYTLPTGAWTHLLWTADGTGKVSLYVDGVYDSSVTVESGDDAPCPGELIGGDSGSSFDGVIDDLRIYRGGVGEESAARIWRDSTKTAYLQWRRKQWGDTPPQNTGAYDDYDGDGLDNLAEFFFGLDPQAREGSALRESVLPSISASGGVHLKYRRRLGTTLLHGYEFSTDLRTWVPLEDGADFGETTTADGNGNEFVDFELNAPLSGSKSGFIRLVTAEP